MKTVVFGFSRPKKWKPYAAAIMWCDDIEYSHAYTKFKGSSWGVDFIYQQSGSHTNFMSGLFFFSNNIAVEEYEMDVSEEMFNAIGNHCVTREGISYGIKQTIGKAIVKLIYMATAGYVTVKNPIRSETDCIEEQCLIIQQFLQVQCGLDMDSVSVKPYRDFVASLPNVRRVK